MDGIALLTRASEEKVAFVPDEKIRYGVLVLGRLIKAAIANAAAR